MSCGCNKNKVTQQSVQQQEAFIAQARSQAKAIASAPQAVANKVVAGLNRTRRCYTDAYCQPGERCINGNCV